jgi:hypothetical protein
MSKLSSFVSALAVVHAWPAPAAVQVLNRAFSSSEICPGANSTKCIMKSSGATGTYIASDRRYLNLDASGEPLVNEFIGHLYTKSLNKSEPFCGGRVDDAFSSYAKSSSKVHILKPYEYSFSIKEKASKLLTTAAQVDAVGAATAAGVPAASLNQVAAAITVSFDRVKSRSVELKGIFRYYEINPDILTNFNGIDGDAALRQCKQWLADNDRQIIVGLTGYKLLDAVASDDLTQRFATDLKARLGSLVSDAQLASLKAAFASNIERNVEGRFSPGFELLTVAVAP